MNTTTTNSEIQRKAGLILISLTVLLVMLNVFLSWTIGSVKMLPAPMLKGYTLSPVFFALVIVGLFQIGKRFRNSRSRLKIFCWTSFIFALSGLGQIGKLMSQHFSF